MSPRANYLFFMYGQSCVAAAQFGMRMGFPLPNNMMEDMVVHSINEFLIRTEQPELTEEEKGYYKQGMEWMRLQGKNMDRLLGELLKEGTGKN